LVERLQEKCDILIELVGGLYDINLGDKLWVNFLQD
jgi:hypothetical protein